MSYKCRIPDCGHTVVKWHGQCPSCGEWGSMEEVVDGPLTDRKTWQKKSWNVDAGQGIRALTDVRADELVRIPTGIGEFDRVLGTTGDVSGFVSGEIALLTASPGSGKSTVALEIADRVSRSIGPVLYASGEESMAQIRLRGDRIGCRSSKVFLAPETEIDTIVEAVAELKPAMLIIDSIQTMRLRELEQMPGSPTQVKGCAEALTQMAKTTQVPILLIGHVTKEGIAAGPRMLEHMVDAVLYLEGEKNGQFRILRGEKNRFGSTFEIGIFEMTDKGLLEVPSPSEKMLRGRDASGGGSVVVPVIDGIRPMLLEVQVLTNECMGGSPRRSVVGADRARTDMVMAVLSRKANVAAAEQDVYVNVVGGMKAAEPGADLAIAIAAASSVWRVPADGNMVAIGEVGLAGEIRDVNGMERRLMEAARMGFRRAIVPVGSDAKPPKRSTIELVPVHNVQEAIHEALGDAPENARPRRRTAVDIALGGINHDQE